MKRSCPRGYRFAGLNRGKQAHGREEPVQHPPRSQNARFWAHPTRRLVQNLVQKPKPRPNTNSRNPSLAGVSE